MLAEERAPDDAQTDERQSDDIATKRFYCQQIFHSQIFCMLPLLFTHYHKAAKHAHTMPPEKQVFPENDHACCLPWP